jgi:hypothetical protein
MILRVGLYILVRGHPDTVTLLRWSGKIAL